MTVNGKHMSEQESLKKGQGGGVEQMNWYDNRFKSILLFWRLFYIEKWCLRLSHLNIEGFQNDFVQTRVFGKAFFEHGAV
mmetsp:Transcript_52097/g.62774  ORF Transcript_52097/g.62774 Transcript_52097/m.62774 type:complete len:80 (+) Transcript_52097:86-325(+)